MAPTFVKCPDCGRENLPDPSETQVHEKGCRWAGQAVPATDPPRIPFHDFRRPKPAVAYKPERTVPFREAVLALVLFSSFFGVAGYWTGQDAADRFYEPLVALSNANMNLCKESLKYSQAALGDSKKDLHSLWGIVLDMFHATPGDDADKVLKRLCDTFPYGKRP